MNKTIWKYIFIFSILALALNMNIIVYNNYVPLFLQAGNPNFSTWLMVSAGFGLSAFWAGIIMSIDNVLGLILTPFIGMFSDKTGKRKPFITWPSIILAAAFVLIPVVISTIPSAKSGDLSSLILPFIILLTLALTFILTNLSVSVVRNAYLLELVPSNQRSKMFGFLNLITSIGGLGLTFAAAPLYNISRILPFAVSAVFMILAAVLIIVFVKESPKNEFKQSDNEQATLRSIFSTLKGYEADEKQSLIAIIITLFFVSFGMAAFQTYSSSYAVKTLGMGEANSILLVAMFFIGMLVMSIPAGYIAARIGRRKTIRIGQVIYGLTMVVAFMVPYQTPAMISLIILGAAYALIDVNMLATFSDILRGSRSMGTIIGLHSFFATLSTIAAVPLAGWIFGLFQNNYNLLWLIGAVTTLIAFVAMLFVKRGEVQQEESQPSAS
jgi:MFS family permease